METQQRLQMITTLNEEADQKRLALTHALGAQECTQQGEVSTHDAPLTQEEQAIKYERDLWERLQLNLNEVEKLLRELGQLEQMRGAGNTSGTMVEHTPGRGGLTAEGAPPVGECIRRVG